MPNVLAQAALPQKISEVQSKVEESDDKDCKDDASEEVDELLRFDFVSVGILEFIDDLQKLIEIDKYKKDYGFEFEFELASASGQRLTSYPSFSGNLWVRLAGEEKVERITDQLNSYYRYNQDLKIDASHSKVVFASEDGDLTVKIFSEKENKKSAEDFAKLYNNAFEIGVCSKSVEERPKIIYENSKATSENNQVFIVTRLPRGSLNELLKQDAKAEGK